VELPSWAYDANPRPWITVSPKEGVLTSALARADEIKLLVDARFNLERARALVGNHSLVYLQPVNSEHDLDAANVNRCLSILAEAPRWRISIQLHKVWRVR
jgi:organic radical activating enzyme